MMTSVIRCQIPGPSAGDVKIHLVRDCDPDFTRDLPKVDEIVVLSYTDGTAKVACGPNLTLDETVEVMMKGEGTVEDKTVRGRTVYTLLPKEGVVLDGDRIVADLKKFIHLAKRQDPDELWGEWEQRRLRREQRAKQPQPVPQPKKGEGSAPRVTLADVKGGAALAGLKPKSPTPVVAPPSSPAPQKARGDEKPSEVIARLMETDSGRNAVAAARMACGVSDSGPIPAAKLQEVADMAEMLA